MRHMFKSVILCAGLVVSSGAASAQTLSDTLATAYRNSGILEQQRAVLRATDESVAQAVAALRPVISYISQYSYSDSSLFGNTTDGSLSIQADMLLFDFGETRLGVEIQKEVVLATRAALLDAENTILFQAVTAFLEVRRSEAFVQLTENNVRLLQEQLRAARDRFEVGEVTRTDVSLAEARLAAARSALAAERGGFERARELYRVAVGVYPDTLVAPPPPPTVPATEQAAVAQAETTNPLIIQMQHDIVARSMNLST